MKKMDGMIKRKEGELDGGVERKIAGRKEGKIRDRQKKEQIDRSYPRS